MMDLIAAIFPNSGKVEYEGRNRFFKRWAILAFIIMYDFLHHDSKIKKQSDPTSVVVHHMCSVSC